jgi:hypothetical protein
MNAARRPAENGAARQTAGRRSPRIIFQPSDVLGCIRVDLSRPADGATFGLGEVGRRIYRACAGMTDDVTLQLVVGPDTPLYDPQIPPGVRVQIVAPDAQTLQAWRAAAAEGQL